MYNNKLANYLASVRNEIVSTGLADSEDKFFIDSIFKVTLISFSYCQNLATHQGWKHALEKCEIPMVSSNKEASDELVAQWNMYQGTGLDNKLECAEILIRNNQKEIPPRAHNMIVEILENVRGGEQSNVA